MLQDRHKWNPVCELPTDLVVPVRVDPTGLNGPTPSQARGPRWRRTSNGLFVPAGTDSTVPEQRILERSMRLTGGAVTGWAACRMNGANFFDGLRMDGRTPIPVPLNCLPRHQIRKQPGDDLIRDLLRPREIVFIGHVPCAVVLRATFDAMRYSRDVREAAVALDMMAAAELASIKRMGIYLLAKQAWEGIQKCRDAVPLADEHSRSPQESRMRLVWVLDALRPRPLANPPLFDLNGRLLGYPDLIDPAAGVVGEYDGEDHRDVTRHSSDVDREATFRDHGLEVFRVTGPDLRKVGPVVDRIHSAYRRATHVPPERRTWTLTPPPWWPPTESLDQLLDRRDPLTDADYAR
jgi:hypothetical protein